MTIGLVGRKCGMTQIFVEDGTSIPVTIIEVEPNRITQIKNIDTDGYSAVQFTVGSRRSSRVKKSQAGNFAKANTEAGRGLWELRNDTSNVFELGGEMTVESFAAGQKVDVTGTSKGKGFQGGVKRWNFQMQDATHGNSISHRAPGSIGQCQTPGRVFKGKKMAGHMGSRQVTTQNLEVVRIDQERNLLLIKGAVPGAPGSDIIVRPAIKARA
ncbi:MAG: large subunit ribosomal protein L3 [Cellvibrionaceae bacterium]|jgi:large subunit ribosomal protein L3